MNNDVGIPDKQHSTQAMNTGTDAVAALCGVRLILGRGLVVPGASWGPSMYRHGFRELGLMDLTAMISYEQEKTTLPIVLKRLQQRLDELEPVNPQLDGQLAKDIQNLTMIFGLNDTESAVLTFCILMETYEWLGELTWKVGELSGPQLFKVLGMATGLGEPVIRKALSANAALRSSGLISLTLETSGRMKAAINLLTGLMELIAEGRVTREAVLSRHTEVCKPSTLKKADYAYLDADINLLMAYLKQRLRSPVKGSNVLLYGPPGTGKTELARLVATELQATGVEVASENQEGEPVKGYERLQAYRIVQRIASSQSCLLVIFDEAEDVFSNDDDESTTSEGKARGRKAWINKSLESNTIPTIWITNHVKCMDPAFLRRFDLVIEVPIPPRNTRTNMIAAAWGEHGVSKEYIQHYASVRGLSPAMVATAARVATTVRTSQLDGAAVLDQVATGHLHAVGVHANEARSVETVLQFDTALINCSVDPTMLIKGLDRQRAGRILFDGPSGSGKSELAQHITTSLGLDVIECGAAELLGSYMGESERNIAQLFQRAAHFGRAILIDEVDSLLTTRNENSRSWEVTLVNEFLRQLERFHGVFIATTNRLESIDAAAKRRFDVIAKFSALLPLQLETVLNQVMRRWSGTDRISELDAARIKELPSLTLGDIAAAVRRCELFGDRRMGGLMAALVSAHPERPATARVGSLNRVL